MTELYPIEGLLVYWVYRVHTEGVTLLLRRFREAGHAVTPEQFGVLARLSREEGLNQAQLGKRMLKDRHNMTRILNLLEDHGYIERRRDGGDRRIFRIYLTEKGKAAQKELAPIVNTHLDELLDHIPDRDQQTIVRNLKQIVANIEEKNRAR